ncbi:hypothetical protein, variant [Saprolegnia diclina VS20]|uniref:FYVE-type domain-containing protein n=1 Tax=Saprolegnia diclina (strain VS20) TaxID=1156394 RepID=T0RWB6_SAPDV|nr:hypothetical protein, variant [Saprolegnia diclina VS20]EQC34627.1 hypothetical protein, variant [Saprolegnia diclina VS20]|eukprot:XP_008612033.1 hypothetical protein, variant [Saprolegnia diclina VS20]
MYAALDETRRHRAALKDYLLSPSHTLVPHAKHATVIGACFVCLRKFYIVRPKHRCPLCCEVVCSRCTWSLDVLGRDHHLHQVVVCVSCYFDKRIQDLVTEGDSDDDDDDPGAAYPNDRDDDDDTSSNDEESYSEDVYPWTPTSDRRISMDNTTNAAAGHAKVSELDPLPETPAPSRPKPQRASRLRPRRYAFVKRDELVPKRELIPKRGATQCERCHRSFKLLHRKHHCHTVPTSLVLRLFDANWSSAAMSIAATVRRISLRRLRKAMHSATCASAGRAFTLASFRARFEAVGASR